MLNHYKSSLFVVTVLTQSAIAADGVEWQTLAAAMEAAQQESKLVMIVQGPESITTSFDQSVVAKSYVRAALSDSRLKDFYDFRVTTHYRPTGRLTAMKHPAGKPTTGAPSHANVMTYFCQVNEARDLQTLHFFVGFPTADQLQAHCEWASQLQMAIVDFPESQRIAAVREAHRKELIRDGMMPTVIPSRTDLATALQTAATMRDRRLIARFGRGWTADEQRRFVGSLRPLADVEDSSAHLTLAIHPLVTLASLEQPAFEALTKQVYWRPPQRRQALVNWFRQQRKRNRPLLLIASESGADYAASLADGFDHRVWKPKRNAINELLEHFDILELTRTELVCLTADLDVTIPDETVFNELRFALFGGSTDNPTYLEHDDSEARLHRTLKRFMEDE